MAPWKLFLALYVTLTVAILVLRMVRGTAHQAPARLPVYDRVLQELDLQFLIAAVFLLVWDLAEHWSPGLLLALSIGPWFLTAGYSLQMAVGESPWYGPARTVWRLGAGVALVGLLWAVWAWVL